MTEIQKTSVCAPVTKSTTIRVLQQVTGGCEDETADGCPIRPSTTSVQSTTRRVLLITMGTLSLLLGLIGAFVPLLPTTCFLLLAAACYYRSSQKCYAWLMGDHIVGRYLAAYQEGRGVSLHAKISTVAVLWLTIGVTAVTTTLPPAVRVVLLTIAVGVSIHILRIKSCNRTRPPRLTVSDQGATDVRG